jgi:hypothetical protein
MPPASSASSSSPSSSSSSAAAARGATRHGKPLALFTIGRMLLSAEDALSFSLEEAQEALGLFRALLALLVAGPAAAALSLFAPGADGAWWPFLAGFALISATTLALARWRLLIDDEMLPLPNLIFGEAGMPVIAALFVGWVATYNAGLFLLSSGGGGGAAAAAAAAAAGSLVGGGR